MDVGILSDLHETDGSRTDNFKNVEKLFVETGEELVAKCDLVVLDGDLRCPRQSEGRNFREKFAAIRKAHKRTENFFERRRARLRMLKGNHDNMFPMPRRFEVVYPNCALVVTHGHEFDKWNSKYKFVGEAATVLAGLIERVGWPNAETVLGSFAERIVGSDSRAERSIYSEGMKRDVLRFRSRTAFEDHVIRVIGHTHDLGVREEPTIDATLVQSGRCCHGRVDFVIVNLDARSVRTESRRP